MIGDGIKEKGLEESMSAFDLSELVVQAMNLQPTAAGAEKKAGG
jgi:hypothetical protein